MVRTTISTFKATSFRKVSVKINGQQNRNITTWITQSIFIQNATLGAPSITDHCILLSKPMTRLLVSNTRMIWVRSFGTNRHGIWHLSPRLHPRGRKYLKMMTLAPKSKHQSRDALSPSPSLALLYKTRHFSHLEPFLAWKTLECSVTHLLPLQSSSIRHWTMIQTTAARRTSSPWATTIGITSGFLLSAVDGTPNKKQSSTRIP